MPFAGGSLGRLLRSRHTSVSTTACFRKRSTVDSDSRSEMGGDVPSHADVRTGAAAEPAREADDATAILHASGARAVLVWASYGATLASASWDVDDAAIEALRVALGDD